MTVAEACVLAAGLMPLLFTGIAKATGKRFNNRDPREWQSRLSGLPARAHAAHLNCFEALPLFAAGVIFAEIGGAEQARVDGLASAFVALRLGFGAAYLADWATLRSVLWLGALVCTVALFFAGA